MGKPNPPLPYRPARAVCPRFGMRSELRAWFSRCRRTSDASRATRGGAQPGAEAGDRTGQKRRQPRQWPAMSPGQGKRTSFRGDCSASGWLRNGGKGNRRLRAVEQRVETKRRGFEPRDGARCPAFAGSGSGARRLCRGRIGAITRRLCSRRLQAWTRTWKRCEMRFDPCCEIAVYMGEGRWRRLDAQEARSGKFDHLPQRIRPLQAQAHARLNS